VSLRASFCWSGSRGCLPLCKKRQGRAGGSDACEGDLSHLEFESLIDVELGGQLAWSLAQAV